ncbi:MULTISPECIES: FAD-dependent monooxygenase [Pseudomonas]|uniref:FAD-dependent monooxygenase n=1 Tax=Pseudomonas TaxID=286 RepID=UPI002114AAC8|nr:MULTISPECIES: FAD-dependent monooxygenase [unclassified Pseudomonas]MCV2228734.1 FAD-dependent monooxygenase [Pseudomonas sp. AU10]
MNAWLADHYRVGQVFLVGDAAHIHPPPARRMHSCAVLPGNRCGCLMYSRARIGHCWAKA